MTPWRWRQRVSERLGFCSVLLHSTSHCGSPVLCGSDGVWAGATYDCVAARDGAVPAQSCWSPLQSSSAFPGGGTVSLFLWSYMNSGQQYDMVGCDTLLSRKNRIVTDSFIMPRISLQMHKHTTHTQTILNNIKMLVWQVFLLHSYRNDTEPPIQITHRVRNFALAVIACTLSFRDW
jgi:hypothetical protein